MTEPLAGGDSRLLTGSNHTLVNRSGNYMMKDIKSLFGHAVLGDQLLNAINWLLERKIPFDRVNDHDPENVAKYGEGGKKIYAHCYIDDKNIGGFPGWLACVEEIERMEEAYKTILKEDKTKV
ncbi:hypothetical protein NXW75_13555 [Bacteroides xylanisolvens]|nr:hypothetical protein [Bacteroides xylanisolvens]